MISSLNNLFEHYTFRATASSSGALYICCYCYSINYDTLTTYIPQKSLSSSSFDLYVYCISIFLMGSLMYREQIFYGGFNSSSRNMRLDFLSMYHTFAKSIWYIWSVCWSEQEHYVGILR